MDWRDGQQRRAWLDRQDARLGNALSYYLGPAAAPVNALAQAGAMMSPGADIADAYQYGGETMRADGPVNALQGLGMTGAALVGMALPGSVKGYHGTAAEGLDMVRAQSTRGALGPGAYFSPARNVAERYGENVYEADLSDVFDGIGSRDSDVNPFAVWRDQTSRLIDAAPDDKRDEIAAAVSKMGSGDGYPLYVRIAQAFRDETAAQDLFRRAGFKGISGSADGPEIVMFDDIPVGGAGNALAPQGY